MKIKRIKVKGKEIVYGIGSHKEIHEKLGRFNDYNEVLDALEFILYQYYVNILHKNPNKMRVDRSIYGKRKII